MKFSIIVPVYNAANFLETCLNSVINQKITYEYEIILVDDFSSDNSVEIIEKLSLKYSRIILLKHNKNKGQAIARSTGMSKASGDYILHLDADDWYIPDSLQPLFCKIDEIKPDILISNISLKYPNREIFIKEDIINEAQYEMGQNNTIEIFPYFFQNSGTKIVKRELVQSLLINESDFETTAEDFLYSIEIFFRANKIYSSSASFYVWNVHENSLTQSIIYHKKINNQITLLKLLKVLIDKYSPNKLLIQTLIDYQIDATKNNLFFSSLECTKNLIYKNDLLEAYSNLNILNQNNNLKKYLNNKLPPFFYALRKYGLVSFIKIILYKFIKKFSL